MLRRLSSDDPEYKALTEYLMNRNATPEVRFGYQPSGTRGDFETRSWLNNDKGIPANGRITLNDMFTSYNFSPEDAKKTLRHELTHAADGAMEYQAFNQARTPEAVQFQQGYDKLNRNASSLSSGFFRPAFKYPRTEMVEKIAPTFAKEHEQYRSSLGELPAFGMGNAPDPRPKYDSWKTPDHVDATQATEFQILLDLANREAKKYPNRNQR